MRRLSTLAVILLLGIAASAQSKDLKKAESRVQQSSDALTTFSTLLGDNGVVAKLVRKAKAVAVLRIVLTDGLLDKEIRGHGVLTFNDAGGWSAPTFLNCKGMRMEWGRSIFRPKQHLDVVFLFMDDRSFGLIHGWINKGPEIKGKQLALGPIVHGKGADEVENTASVIYYSFEGQKLSGEEFPNSSMGSSMRMSHDDGLNKKIFGKKFKEIRSSSEGVSAVPTSLIDLQKMFNDKFGSGSK
jgi:lipid-binding SYLF domain-containing protein